MAFELLPQELCRQQRPLVFYYLKALFGLSEVDKFDPVDYFQIFKDLSLVNVLHF